MVKGYPIANGIVSSVRVDDDGPDVMWAAGYKVYDAFGPLVANIYCNIGYIFVKKTTTLWVLLFMLISAFIWLVTAIQY